MALEACGFEEVVRRLRHVRGVRSGMIRDIQIPLVARAEEGDQLRAVEGKISAEVALAKDCEADEDERFFKC